MHNNRNNHETLIIPQTIIVPTKSVNVGSHIVSCSEGLAKHHKGGTQYLVVSTSSRLKAIIACKGKINILFMIIFICPITFEFLEMGGLCI